MLNEITKSYSQNWPQIINFLTAFYFNDEAFDG